MTSAKPTTSSYFNLEKVDEHNVKSIPPHLSGIYVPGRTYGGLLVAQAVKSFTTLNPHLYPHTINYKYIAPVQSNDIVHFIINHYDDGNVASIFAIQSSQQVGSGHIQHTKNAEYLDSSPFFCPPEYGPPDDYQNTEELAEFMEGKMKIMMLALSTFPIEVRPVESALFPASEHERNAMWLRMKTDSRAGLKPTDGLYVALFLSDFSILQIASDKYEKSKIKINSVASLHHSVRIHDANFDPFGWFLFVGECEVSSFGRALLISHVFNESRKCVMTVVQEAYYQRASENKL